MYVDLNPDNDKIKLHIISDNKFYETYPKIFQNSIRIDNSNWIVTVNRIKLVMNKLVMNKTQIITVPKDSKYYCLSDNRYDDMKQLYDKYNISW